MTYPDWLHSSWQVEVYDTVTLTLQRSITVPGHGSCAYGLIVCPNNNCLCVSEWYHNNICRVELLSASNAVKKWSVARRPAGLSENIARSWVVACCGANKLQEQTTHGSLVREICLQSGVTCPWHAIQLFTGDHVVSRDVSPGVVSVVEVDGQVITNVRHWSDNESNKPRCDQERRHFCRWSTQQQNPVSQQINGLYTRLYTLTVYSGGIQHPCRSCLDMSRGWLCVGELGSQHRVLVCRTHVLCVTMQTMYWWHKSGYHQCSKSAWSVSARLNSLIALILVIGFTFLLMIFISNQWYKPWMALNSLFVLMCH